MDVFENMISETEMLNRISSHNRMTKAAHGAHLLESRREKNRAPMRGISLAWGWLVSRV